MSRLYRYKENCKKFIKKRSCLSNKENIPNSLIHTIVYNYIMEHDNIFAMLLLTILNNRNQKNEISLQGYFASSGVGLLFIMLHIMDNKSSFIKEYDIDTYNTTINYIILCFNKSIAQNINSISKTNIKNTNIIDKTAGIFAQILLICNDKLSYDNIMNEHIFEYNSREPASDILEWYLNNNNNEEAKKKFSKIKQIKESSMEVYINKKIGSLCEMAFCLGWLMGYGDKKHIKKIKKISHNFVMIYKISNDYINIEKDILNSDGYTLNYVVNYGLQKSFEIYLDNMEQFMEGAMILDFYTDTIKEIISSLTKQINYVIDEQTSPDLRSNYSNI